ncbi:hypothetical protein [Streptomyces sparsus]
MAAHRRPLVTSAVAGGLLCALWFVPTAKATNETEPQASSPPAASTTQSEADRSEAVRAQVTRSQATRSEAGQPEAGGPEGGAAEGTAPNASPRLADTGSFDTTPYLTGGIAFLGLGAGLVVHATRRTRPTA